MFSQLHDETCTARYGQVTPKISCQPGAKCVELKSLKLYLQSYRNDGIFYENVTNTILDDLVAMVTPRHMKLVAAFTARGGITTNVTVTYEDSAS